jgi:alpha-tubulin suppressor-like RCC1 family protein
VKCWGWNPYGQLGLGNTTNQYSPAGPVDLGTGKTALSIVAADHTCARLSDGSLKCWGFNGYGELGLGDTTNRGDNPGEMGDNLPTVKLFSSVW